MKEKKPKPTKQERIAKYLEAVPGAIDGAGGGAQTFKVACALYNGWGLSEDETLAWLKVYNAKCEPRWSEKELKHKAKDAASADHEKPRGYLIGASTANDRCEPVRDLPTKPIASGQIPTTLTTLISPHSPVHKNSLTKNSKSYALRVSQENNVVNVVKCGTPPLVCPKNGENAEKSPVTDTEPAGLTAAELAKARRIAGELVKLHKAGAINGAEDPEATFYACLLRDLNATFTGKRGPETPFNEPRT